MPQSRSTRLACTLLLTLAVAGCTPSQIGGWLRREDTSERTVYRPVQDERGQDEMPLPVNHMYDDRDVQPHTRKHAGADFDVDVWQGLGGSMLVYASTMHDPNPEIYVKSAEGQAVMRLTHHFSRDIHPHFSPDGKWIAFASDRNGNFDVFVTSAERGGATWQLTSSENDDIYPSWSPEGNWLSYSSRAPSGEWELWLLNLKTEQATNLGPGLFPEWSPTGDRLAFQRASNRGQYWYSLWVIDVNGNRVMEVVSSDSYAAINPSWSPDGEWICYASVYKSRIAQQEGRLYNGDDIWVVRPDGSHNLQVVSNPGADWNPSWGADGRVYFCSERSGARSIWSVKPILPAQEPLSLSGDAPAFGGAR